MAKTPAWHQRPHDLEGKHEELRPKAGSYEFICQAIAGALLGDHGEPRDTAFATDGSPITAIRASYDDDDSEKRLALYIIQLIKDNEDERRDAISAEPNGPGLADLCWLEDICDSLLREMNPVLLTAAPELAEHLPTEGE